MQDNLNKLDILFRQKDAEAEYDVSHITDHWSQMETVLNAKHWSFHFKYFKGTGFLKTIIIIGMLGYVGYIILRNNHNPVPPRSMKTKQSMFAEPQPVTVGSDTIVKINSAESFKAGPLKSEPLKSEPFKKTKRLKRTKKQETIRVTNNNKAIPGKKSVLYEKKSAGIEHKKKYVGADSVKTSVRGSSPVKRSKKSKITGQADHLKSARTKSTSQHYDSSKSTISKPVLKFRSVATKSADTAATIDFRTNKIMVSSIRDTIIR